MKILRQVNFSLKDLREKYKKSNARAEDYDFRNRYNMTDDEEVRKEWKQIANKDLKALDTNNKRVKKDLVKGGAILTTLGGAYGAGMAGLQGGSGKEVLLGAGLGAAGGAALTGVAALGAKIGSKALEKKIRKAKENPKGKEAKELERMRDNLKVADGKMSCKAFDKKWNTK